MADFTPHEAPAHDAQSLPVMVYGKPVGRDEALKTIYTHLKGNRPVLLHGGAGMGKTALAGTLAGAYAQQPGGVLWLNVSESTLEELIVRVGRAYGVLDITSSNTPIGMLGAAANTLAQHKPLVVLDGRLDPQVTLNFVSKVANGLPVMLVSEPELEGSWTGIEITKLDADSAASFYKQQAAIGDHNHDIDIFGVVKLLEYTPFAMAVAARSMYASKQSPGEYHKVLQPAVEATSGSGTLGALTTAYKTLTGPLQGLLLMMGATFTGQASAEFLSMVSGAAPDSIQQAMNVLTQLYLVERTQRYGAPYYRLHTITYTFLQNFLRSSNRLDGLQEKVRDTTLAYAQKYSAADNNSHNKLAAEMENFLAAAEWASEQGDRDVANQIVLALTQAGDFVSARGYLYELLRLRGLGTGFATAFPAYGTTPAAVGVPPEDEFDDDRFDDDLEADDFDEDEDEDEEFDDELEDFEAEDADEDDEPAQVLDELGKLRVSLAAARQQSDVTRQTELLKTIGKLQVAQKMENEAITSYTEALNHYETNQDSVGILEMLDMLSALMVKTDNAQPAVLHATQGIKLASELNDDDTRMHLLMTLGDARQQLGESEDAETAYRQALEVARNRDDRQNEGITLYKLGYAQLDNGEATAAIETWEEALKLFKEQNKRDYEGRVLGALGTAYGELERWSEAISFYTSALYIAREVGDSEDEALQLGSLGYASVQSNQLGQAVLRYRQALHLHYESKDRENIVSTLVDLARLLVQSQRHLTVAELLIDDALRLEPNDKEVKQLNDRISSEKMLAEANGTDFVDVTGTAQDYAENAYRLLEQ